MMGRFFKQIKTTVQPVIFFVPVTVYFFAFAVLAFISYGWLQNRTIIPGSSFADIFKLLLKTAAWFIVILLALALVTSLIAFIYFVTRKHKKLVEFRIQTDTGNDSKERIQKINIYLSPVIKPLLGFIKLRLQYDHTKFTEKFILAEDQYKSIFPISYSGKYNWSLPEIKEYQVNKLIVYFEDFFQFFSFTASVPVNDHFQANPFSDNTKTLSVSPRKTEDTATRIDEIKRIEGEYLNYKNFENNDDVRRIVWKIYAKNKELVVRIPEVLDPYASHAWLYPSFFTNYDIEGNDTAEVYFLNVYKTMVWNIYQQLNKQGFALRYVSDQEAPAQASSEDEKNIRYAVTTSKWQTQKDLRAFVKPKDAAVVIISSLCSVSEVQQLLQNTEGNTLIVFIQLSRSLHYNYFSGILKWLFVQQEKDAVELYKSKWRLSAIRSKILHNERQLETLLSKQNKTVLL